ncbi:MAG: hypothetical protein L7U72_13100 [Rubripirellula sp.]|nr:hypothetical protein [Rubripirellula sp.]
MTITFDSSNFLEECREVQELPIASSTQKNAFLGNKLGSLKLGSLKLGLLKIWVVLITAQSLSFESASAIDIFDESSVFNRRLSGANRSVLDGQSFRAGLTRLARANQINLWIDREVNPSSIIETGALGPTLLAAFEQIASTNDCVVMPIGNVMLIGRTAWVDQLTTHVLQLSASEMGEVVNINWDQLTTPSEAFSSIMLDSNAPSVQLPHDLWPENHWQEIHRGVAEIMIRGQFEDKTLQNGEQRLATTQANQSLSRLYKLQPKTLKAIDQELRVQFPKVRPRKTATGVTIQGSASDHRSITHWLLERIQKPTSVKLDADTFSLKKISTSAENAFRQLAATANLQCEIHPSAVNACKGIVTLEGQDVTLRNLMEGIAKQIDVMIDWREAVIVIHRLPASINE